MEHIKTMEKDIYIIKNDLNDKVYIGQAIDCEQRFKNHCKPSSIKQNSLIDRAINKYGKEHFYYEVLETSVEDYNERERYWIQLYNSLTPNGYNIQQGGEEPPHYSGIEHPLATITDLETLNCLKEDLKNGTLSLLDLARKYNTNKKTINNINQGICYASINETYPLRKIPNQNGKLNDSQVWEIINILTFSYRQYEDIASQYNVSISTIKNINAGTFHKMPNVEYPVRNYKNSGKPAITYEQTTEIINLLKNTTLSMREISRRYNINHSTVQGINSGTAVRYKRKEEKYPIRQF